MKVFSVETGLDAQTRDFYQHCMRLLTEAEVPFLVGGAYALGGYTGILRHTKDLDLFMKPTDYPRALEVFEQAGFRTEITEPIWLAKAFSPDGAFVDLIYRSGNGISEVDDEWFAHAGEAMLLDLPVKICPPEETIWSKGFIMERHRYDGPDVAHYLLACGRQMDWQRLLRRFGPDWRVLLSHLILFSYIYPNEQDVVPREVWADLFGRFQKEMTEKPTTEPICRGTLLSRFFFLVDVGPWGRKDARFTPRGTLTPEEVQVWEREMKNQAPAMLEEAGIHVAPAA